MYGSLGRTDHSSRAGLVCLLFGEEERVVCSPVLSVGEERPDSPVPIARLHDKRTSTNVKGPAGRISVSGIQTHVHAFFHIFPDMDRLRKSGWVGGWSHVRTYR